MALLLLGLLCGCAAILCFGTRAGAAWHEFSPIKYSGTTVLATAIGAIGWIPLNVILTDRWSWRRAHERGRTSEVEQLLYKAFTTRKAIQITLKSGIVYEGIIQKMPVPKIRLENSFVEFIPTRSGFRTSATKRLS